MLLSDDALYIINKLNKKGYEAYVVGGCVRDYLIGKTPKDFDITTNAPPMTVKEIFRRAADTGLKHGTVTVLNKNSAIEVTTYRIDGEYTDNRRPDSVTFTKNLKDDLLRRDFTINAIAYHPKEGYIDYFGGLDDLKQRLIRGVGAPEKRFNEDALRMLRAIRFAAVLGFEIENETKTAILKRAELLKNISAERIRDEFIKIITSPNPELLYTLAEMRLLYYFKSQLQDYLQEYAQKIISALQKSDRTPDFCLAVFFAYAELDVLKEILSAFKMDNKTKKTVLTLNEGMRHKLPFKPYEIKKALSHIGAPMFWRLIKLHEIITNCDCGETIKTLDSILENGDCYTLKDLAVNGGDMGELEGKMIGDTLNKLLDYVMLNPRENTKERLMVRAGEILTPPY